MGNGACVHQVSPSTSATALLVDLRNFTTNLNVAEEDERGINVFCLFLSEFYALCLDTCLVALPPTLRSDPPLYMSSTGDGVLILFLHDSHVRHGFLAALIMHSVLKQQCERYNARSKHSETSKTSFGIGVESGEVSRVHAHAPKDDPHPVVDTYIGSCINIAARAEAMTKVFHEAHTIIAEHINDLLCRELFGESYSALIETALDPDVGDDKRLTVHDEMNDLNRKLCLTFIHHHNLRGVDKPVPLFRVADSSAFIGNPRFDWLVERLTDGAEHLSGVAEFLNAQGDAQEV